MSKSIKAVIFDLGGTLEDTRVDTTRHIEVVPKIRQKIQSAVPLENLSDQELLERIYKGMEAYKSFRETHERELTPQEVFLTFVFPDSAIPPPVFTSEKDPFWDEVAYIYESEFYQRTCRPETPKVLATLKKEGFRLGVISNILSRLLVPERLQAYGISQYFDVILTSAEFGLRKPNPKIFLAATEQLHIQPKDAIYVGDTVSRDVVGARRAGYALAVQIRSHLTSISDTSKDTEKPDVLIQSLEELLKILPSKERTSP
ncbi:MAG: HAD family hydrolase [Spirochaetales bacterium]